MNTAGSCSCPLPDQDRQLRASNRSCLDSPDFKDLADATRRGYERYLRIVRDKWGSLEIKGLEPQHVLAFATGIRRLRATANAVVRTLSALIAGQFLGATDLTIHTTTSRSSRRVTAGARGRGNDRTRREARATLDVACGCSRALHRPTRSRCPRDDLDPGAQRHDRASATKETGRQLVIPAHQKLLAVLAKIPRQTIQILCSSRLEPWTPGGFRSSWLANLKGPLAPIREGGFVFHGLRKSAVVTLLKAGCTDAETAAITGQSRPSAFSTLDRSTQKKLAAAAILKWERSQNESLVCKTHCKTATRQLFAPNSLKL